MSKDIQAWSFLVSRNQFLDYRTVVAPDFICDANVSSMLARETTGDPTPDWITKVVEHEKVGEVTLIYRITEAHASFLSDAQIRELGITAGDVLRDSVGREVYVIQGIAVRGKYKINSEFEIPENVYVDLKEKYQDFWGWITPQPAIASKSVLWEFETDTADGTTKQTEISESPSLKGLIQESALDVISQNKISLHSYKQYYKPVKYVNYLDGSNILVHQYDDASFVKKASVGRLCISDETSRTLAEIYFNRRYVTHVRIDRNQQIVVSSNILPPDQNFVKKFNIPDRKEVDLYESALTELGRVCSLSLLLDGTVVAVAIKPFTLLSPAKIVLVDIGGGGTRGKVSLGDVEITSMTGSIIGKENLLVAGDSQGYIRVWNCSDLRQPIFELQFSEGGIESIVFSYSQEYFVVGSSNGLVRIFSYADGVKNEGELRPSGGNSAIKALDFNPDGKFLVSGDAQGNLILWDFWNRRKIAEEKEAHKKAINSVSFSPSGQLIATGGEDGMVKVWRLE